MRRERETIEHMWNRCSEMREREIRERGRWKADRMDERDMEEEGKGREREVGDSNYIYIFWNLMELLFYFTFICFVYYVYRCL
jgi:hypothetical protein